MYNVLSCLVVDTLKLFDEAISSNSPKINQITRQTCLYCRQWYSLHLVPRLKDKEALLLEENKTQLRKWELRVEETEQRYETRIRDMTSSHDREMDTLKQRHEREMEEQQRLRKEELCAVLSVQQTTSALKELTEKVNLSADEIGNLTAKLDVNRLVGYKYIFQIAGVYDLCTYKDNSQLLQRNCNSKFKS